MRITAIPQSIRNVRRATEIISVLSKYGLAGWLSQLPLDQLGLDFLKGLIKAPDGEALARHTREARIRLAITELGPTFIKLGQILSTRPDLAGVVLADELKELQTDVPADSFADVKKVVEEELGQPIDELFLLFEEEPIASASIGQVHRARLADGDRVVVKVQHVDIQQKIREDLEVLATLAHLAERVPELARFHPVETVAEFQRALRRELDFGREERNLLHFAAQLADNDKVRVPKPFSEFCTGRVLTMEQLDGVKLRQADRLVAAGEDLGELARTGAELYLNMIFADGHYHADPHPGNILVLPGGVIGLLDFGMVGRIDERLREDIEEILLAIVNQDSAQLTTLIMRVGDAPSELDEAALSRDLADFVADYGTQKLDEFDLSGALNDMVEIIRRYDIGLPPQVAMLLKTLIMLEGTGRLLSPQFSLMEVMKPLQRDILMRRLSPARHLKKMRRVAGELEHLAEVMPRRLLDILKQIQTGKFDVHLDHRRLGPSVNRLVLGLIVSALFLGSSLLLAMQVPPVVFHDEALKEQWWMFGLYKVSVLGLLGIVTSVLLGLRLLLAIGKSGHLDQKD